MKKMIWAIGIALISLNCFAKTNSNYAVCSQPYALCTTAPCMAVPGLKDQSVCRCVVKDGPSLGQLPCEKRKPTTNAQGQHLLTSNFSFEDAATNKVMTCTGNHAWTDCLDQPCIIDPQNSNQAICSCTVKKTEKFITFGGECNTASCNTTLYSGATTEMLNEGSQQLIEYLHLKQSPMKNCSIQ